MTRVKATAQLAFYTVSSIRYGALVVPTGVVAFLLWLDSTAFMTVVSVVLYCLAVAAELFSSVVQAIGVRDQAAMVDQVYADIEDYAYKEWQRGEEANQEGPADEAGGGQPIR